MPNRVKVEVDTSGAQHIEQQALSKAKAWTLESSKALLEDISDHWSGHYPPASQSGQAPAVRSGGLAASVQAEREEGSDPDHPIAIISASAPYAKHLEYGTSKMAARPFFRPAIARVRQIIGRKVREILPS